jgi:hypothetical protein
MGGTWNVEKCIQNFNRNPQQTRSLGASTYKIDVTIAGSEGNTGFKCTCIVPTERLLCNKFMSCRIK